MSQETAIELARQALWLAAQISAPAILAGLGVGLSVSVFQAATQIQEQSLLFVPKVTALALALSLTGGWIMVRIVDFTRGLILSLPSLVQ